MHTNPAEFKKKVHVFKKNFRKQIEKILIEIHQYTFSPKFSNK